MLETQFPIQSVLSADSSLIEKAAQTEQGVLITGETGTGKELIARIIHNRSSRAQNAFTVINCALSGDILESEFQAKIEAAANGSVYFEEINELPLHLQAKLVQNHFAVRMIASSSASLQDLVSEKLFRSDLFAKISFVAMNVPALRDRVEQIPMLVRAYIEKYNKITGSNVASTPTAEALDAFTSYTWPGNVRELEHVIERIVIMKGQGTIEASDLPTKVYQASQNAMTGTGANADLDFPRMFLSEKGVDLKNIVAAFENHLVDQALARTNGNKNRASMLLGLNRTTLVEKLRKRGMITPLKASQDLRSTGTGNQE
jgi:transcriptional regulator with PAS, ATPase and Fis domain